MRSGLWLVTAGLTLLVGAGCGKSKDGAAGSTNAASGNPLTAPTDYLGAAAKAKQSSEKTIDTIAINQTLIKNVIKLVMPVIMPEIAKATQSIEIPKVAGYQLTVDDFSAVGTQYQHLGAGITITNENNVVCAADQDKYAGKCYENLMVDLRATNAKLRDRGARIVSMLTGLERDAAFSLLDRAGGAVKTAVIMHRQGARREDAEGRLARHGGSLRAALEERT